LLFKAGRNSAVAQKIGEPELSEQLTGWVKNSLRKRVGEVISAFFTDMGSVS
jgi:hypothetical protein